jgi:MYXO-CTERM domain-containing protein
MVSEGGGPTIYPTGIAAATGGARLPPRPEKAQDSAMKRPFSFAVPMKVPFAIGALIVLVGPAARATVTQPDGTAMPQPANPNELSCCVVNRGFPMDADTLPGLFMYNEINGGDPGLDWIKDAHTTPGTFSPQCGLKGTIVLHGGGCHNALGWYNATNPPTAPAASAIYQIVPADLTQQPPNGIACANNANKPPTPLNDFCPLATRMTTQGYGWADPLPDFAADIRNDPRWAGGPVGFALIGSTANGNLCPQTKYSEADINVKNSSGKPWITTLIYQSTTDPNGYYIAFEDQPTCTASWRGCDPGNPNQGLQAPNGNDGDFNDFVFYVSGIDCAGGGEVCDTGMPGICAGGTTQCANGGMSIKCRQDIQPRAETCNLLDDDCDGVIDNPDAPNLCPNGQVCYQGTCIPPCSTGEFPCIPPYVCDDNDGLCKDPACMNTKCASDQVCYRGVCVGGCDNVVCPPGQVCRIGNCVDPCAGITCDSGQVCEGGACLAACGCRNCPGGKTCSSNGTCVDTGCDKLKCTAPQVCVQGKCVDGCDGVKCPAGQMCSDGQCAIPDGGIQIPEPDGGVVTGAGGDTATGGQTGTGGAKGTGGNVGSGGSTGTGGITAPHEGGVTTCNCDSSGGPSAGGFALFLAALGLGLLRRRATARNRRGR